MDERHLLLLGLLMAQSQHGYSINEFIEKNLGRVSGMKRATAYALLERLERKGLVRMETETVGNYPPRKVYSITPAGREAFFDLLQELLVETDRTLIGGGYRADVRRLAGARPGRLLSCGSGPAGCKLWQPSCVRRRVTKTPRASTTLFNARSLCCKRRRNGSSS